MREKNCPRCGRLDDLSAHVCPVSDELLAELRDFAGHLGRYWKSALRTVWEIDCSTEPYWVRSARNIIGPSGLYKVKLLNLRPQKK